MSWGGSRIGAGRRARHAIASEPHKTRPTVSPRHPVHVIARVVPAVRNLRGHEAYRALAHALERSLRRGDFRIVQLAIRGKRLELVVEATDRIALARGMQGFQVSAARALNRELGRHGGVFADRYRPRAVATRPALRALLELLAPPPARSPASRSTPAHARSRPRHHAPSRAPPKRGYYYSLSWPRHALPQSYLLVIELAKLVARRLR
jgi:hypothetical protein